MYGLFAATDPGTGITNYLFTQGVLGIALVAAIIVIVYQQKKLDKKDDKIEALQDARVNDNREHSRDYQEMAKDNSEVLQLNSQSNTLLATKIEAVKDQR
jgi:ribulose kinase